MAPPVTSQVFGCSAERQLHRCGLRFGDREEHRERTGGGSRAGEGAAAVGTDPLQLCWIRGWLVVGWLCW